MRHGRRGRKSRNETLNGRSRSRWGIIPINLTRRQWIRWFSVAAFLLAAVSALAAFMIYRHYIDYPGAVERDSIRARSRSSSSIALSWEKTRSTVGYKVYYKEYEKVLEEALKNAKQEAAEGGSEAPDEAELMDEVRPDESWTELSSKKPEIKAEELEEDTAYSFVIVSESEKHKSRPSAPRSFSTKKPQKISVDKRITKLTSSKPFKLKVKAETGLQFESSDTSVAKIVNEKGKIKITGPGRAEIKVMAKASVDYDSAEKVVELEVIEADPVDAGGAKARVIYHLDSTNCEVVKSITGADGASVPQGLAYTGDKYYVSYGMGNPSRIVSFDVEGDGKSVSVPKKSINHPNGFTYANENGRCYCVMGWVARAVTYEPTSGEYGSVNLSYGCSGIGYDRKEKLLYTSSRTAMVAYDISDGYSVVRRTGVVKHSGSMYTQDCGGHAGVLLRCLSGSSKHGINYIDLYDMKNGKYLGSISCDLSEVESCIVNDDGFLEILANNTSNTDYIWSTNINIETIGEGL